MVKTIEHFPNPNLKLTETDFKLYPDYGSWNCTTYAYSQDAEYPVIIYGIHKYRTRKDLTPNNIRNGFCTMFVVNEGNFGFIFEDIIYYPSKGDVIIVKDSQPFASYFKECGYDNFFEIEFPLSFFEHMNKDSMFTKLFYDETNRTPNIISLNENYINSIVNKMNKLEKIILSNNENKDIVAWSYLIQITDIIYSQGNVYKSFENIHFLPAKLRDAIEYINANFVNVKNIDEISEHCNITSIYLARLFKKVLDTSPIEYVTSLKITYAKQLLLQGKTLTDVCYESGFNNYTYFISKFKSIVGITPLKYQKNYYSES